MCQEREKVIFIDTEGFSAERFKQIAGEDAKKIAGEIIIYEPTSFGTAVSAITDIEMLMMKNRIDNS